MPSKKAINTAVLGSVVAVIIVGYFLMNYTPVGTNTGEDVEIDVTAFQWGFEPQFITVNKGDHVTLKLSTDDVPHGIAIDDYNVNEPIMIEGDSEAEFLADKEGTYRFYCSIPCGEGHSQQGGYLIVKDPTKPEPETSIITSKTTDNEITLDGEIDDEWSKATESIFTTTIVHENRQIFAKSLHNDSNVYFLLRWQDDAPNNDGTTETDRIALGFDISGDSDIAMGAAGVPHVTAPQQTIGQGTVDIWHWKAFDSHTETANVIDDEFAGPFKQLKEHYYRDDDDKHGGDNQIRAFGVYDSESKEWIVEISRSLTTSDNNIGEFGTIDKQFETGKEYKIAFAVWDGDKGETAGKHAVTDWGILKIE